MAERDDDQQPEELGQLLETEDLAGALENERFKQFLDHLPVAIAVSALRPDEHIVYGNLEFHRLIGTSSAAIEGKGWDAVLGAAMSRDAALGDTVPEEADFLGNFAIPRADGETVSVHAWSNLIEDDDGTPVFRLVALIAALSPDDERATLEERIREKDTLLREIQHRVKNNLQMITALIRMEARRAPDVDDETRFARLAGRVEALALLYQALSKEGKTDEVDLGTYLSQIASAVMQAQAVEGIRLDLKVDAWPVSINVAMPTGLVVNELMTNALKYAFRGRDGGTIVLRSLVDEVGCKVVISDDGIGLPPDVEWPAPGKLGALIVKTLRENAHAELDVDSEPGRGTTVTIRFTRTAASAA